MFKKKFLVGMLSTILVLPFAPVSQSQASSGLLTAILCFSDNAIVFYGSSSQAPRQGAKSKLVDVIFDASSNNGTGWDGGEEIEISLGDAGNGNCAGFFDYSKFPQKGVVSQALLDEVEKDSPYSAFGYSYTDLGVKVGTTRYSIIHATSGYFNPISYGLFIVNYGTGGSSIEENGYSSDGTFISKLIATELPLISATSDQISCTTGRYVAEYLNSGEEITDASFRISLQSNGGELTSLTTTSTTASFAVKDLPADQMIWCEVQAYKDGRLTIAKSTDDKTAIASLEKIRKAAIRAAKRDLFAKKLNDLGAAVAAIENEYRRELEKYGFAVYIS